MKGETDRRHGSYVPRDAVPIRDTAPSEVEDHCIEPPPVTFRNEPVWAGSPFANREQRSILDEAAEIVAGDRQNDYGTPEQNWGRISRIASAMCEMDLSPEVCTKVLIACKLARMITSPKKRDNYVDLAGYSHVLWQVVK